MTPKILVTQLVPQPAIDLLKTAGDVELNPDPDHVYSREELVERVARNDYLYSMLTNRIDEEVMAANSNLKVIAQMAVGYDNIDIAAATARGVPVTHTPGVLTETTADTAWVLLMAVARRIVEADKFMRAGHYKAWGPMLLMGTDVHGKTLGILGFGRIGKAMARRAKGFGMRVIYFDEVRASAEEEQTLSAEYKPFADIIAEADFLTVHTLYAPSTHHLLGEREFALMKKTAYVVNTARGPIVDEEALVKALNDGQIAGAGLDVYEREPVMEPALRKMDKVVLLPHIGSASLETRTEMALMAARNLIAVIRGERPPNLVNPEVWDAR